MPEVANDGAKIHYEVSGNGPTVVLGHSLLCDTTMWRGVAPRLAERYRVINVEARGHGRSTAPGPFTLEDLADDWRRILDAEKVDRAFLVGLSMGGMTSMRLALSAPSRVAGMVLIDSNADREEAARRLRYGALAAVYRRLGLIRPLVGPIAAILFGRTTLTERKQLVDDLAAVVRRHDRHQLPQAIRAVFRRGPILERLSAIDCPTLIVVGEEDKATPVIKSRRMANAIRGARLDVVGRVGHLSALEDPDAIASRVLGFLGEHRW